jgi:hypothetical protein
MFPIRSPTEFCQVLRVNPVAFYHSNKAVLQARLTFTAYLPSRALTPVDEPEKLLPILFDHNALSESQKSTLGSDTTPVLASRPFAHFHLCNVVVWSFVLCSKKVMCKLFEAK